uniref:Uncharacterized protein n=1 Tax=Lepeophtheirus salmonis TaxID=72036 RepID=A0A0K2TLY6_LEPSM
MSHAVLREIHSKTYLLSMVYEYLITNK